MICGMFIIVKKKEKNWKRWGNKKTFSKRFAKEQKRFSAANSWLKEHVFKDSFWLKMLSKHSKYSSSQYDGFLQSLHKLPKEKIKIVTEKLRWDLLESIYQSKHNFSFRRKPSKREIDDLRDLLADIIEVYLNCGMKDDLSTNQKGFTAQNLYKMLMYDNVRGRHNSFCAMMSGKDDINTRRPLLTKRFNMANTFPQVLIAQSRIGREGLNLHKACDHLVVFNTEWNPAVVEQEVGRIDRINSLWCEKMEKWNNAEPTKRGAPPKIKVDFVVFDETYDQYQYKVFLKRRQELSSQLFGTLLDETSLIRVPKKYREEHEKDLSAAFDFEPEK